LRSAEPRKARTRAGLELRLPPSRWPKSRWPKSRWPTHEPLDPDPAQLDARVRRDVDEGVQSGLVFLVGGVSFQVFLGEFGALAPSGVWLGVLLGWLAGLGLVPNIPASISYARGTLYPHPDYQRLFLRRVRALRDRRTLARLVVPAGILCGGVSLLPPGPHPSAGEWVIIGMNTLATHFTVIGLSWWLLFRQVRPHLG
jgi:hypothetical protein